MTDHTCPSCKKKIEKHPADTLFSEGSNDFLIKNPWFEEIYGVKRLCPHCHANLFYSTAKGGLKEYFVLRAFFPNLEERKLRILEYTCYILLLAIVAAIVFYVYVL